MRAPAPAGPRPLGLRERKKIATRRALRTAALRLAAERGWNRLTAEDIAVRAGVSPRTFFNYFSSKEEALVGPDPDAAARLRDAFLARPAGEEPVEAARQVAVAEAAVLAEERPDWALRMRLVERHPGLRPHLVASFTAREGRLAEAVADRTGTDAGRDLYPPLLAAATVCALRVSLQRWREGGFDRSLPALVDEAFTALAAGLPAPRAGGAVRESGPCPQPVVLPRRRRSTSSSDPSGSSPAPSTGPVGAGPDATNSRP